MIVHVYRVSVKVEVEIPAGALPLSHRECLEYAKGVVKNSPDACTVMLPECEYVAVVPGGQGE